MSAILPDGYRWGYAKSSRHQPRARRHIVGQDVQMVCTGGLALIGIASGVKCPACLRWLREYREWQS